MKFGDDVRKLLCLEQLLSDKNESGDGNMLEEPWKLEQEKEQKKYQV